MFLLLTLNIFYTFSSVSIVDFEQVTVSWGYITFKANKAEDTANTSVWGEVWVKITYNCSNEQWIQASEKK